jgi:citrate synthase
MANDMTFTTKVSGTTAQGHELRGHLLTELVTEADFVSSLFLSITGRKPTVSEKKVLNAILVAAIDHGIYPASGFVPRVIAASGNDVYTAMAGTLLALGPRHGGAITGCMEVLTEISNRDGDLEKVCQEYIDEQRAQKVRIAGFGHPHYTNLDPRTKQLFEIAQDANLDPKYVNVMYMIEYALEKSSGRRLVINVDGAIAALLLTMGFDPLAGNAIFGLARVGGSIAHILEEMRDNGTIRRLQEEQVSYHKDSST